MSLSGSGWIASRSVCVLPDALVQSRRMQPVKVLHTNVFVRRLRYPRLLQPEVRFQVVHAATTASIGKMGSAFRLHKASR